MKIAVASRNGKVPQYFSQCENFTLFEVENNQLIKSEVIPKPKYKIIALSNYLEDLGTKVIIFGEINNDVIEAFSNKGMQIIEGAQGYVNVVAQQYLEGILNGAVVKKAFR